MYPLYRSNARIGIVMENLGEDKVVSLFRGSKTATLQKILIYWYWKNRKYNGNKAAEVPLLIYKNTYLRIFPNLYVSEKYIKVKYSLLYSITKQSCLTEIRR